MTERRHELGLTQRDVVERLGILGLATSNRTLSAMEHGQGLDVGRLPELAIALDCTVTYLLGLTADPVRWVPDDVRLPAPAPPVEFTSSLVLPAHASESAVACVICEHSQGSAREAAAESHRA